MDDPKQPEQASSQNRHTEHVHMNFRFSGAWQEYNQRVTSRHQVINLHMTVASVALAFLYSHRTDEAFNFWEVALVLPIASLIASVLLYMHDCMMANIHEFMISCELYNNQPESGLKSMPSYHANKKSAEDFLKNRNLQNYTVILIFLVFNAGPFYLLPGKTRIATLMKQSNWWIYLGIYLVLSATSWVMILEGRDRRIEAMRRQYPDCKVSSFYQRLVAFTRRIASKYLQIDVALGVRGNRERD